MAALAELEEARAVWLAYEERFAERRRREKHGGLRGLGALDDWHRGVWGGNGVVRCGDPAVHPRAPLPEVMRRLVAALERGPGDRCPVCAGTRIGWGGGPEDEPWYGPVCGDCGVDVPRALLTPAATARARRDHHARPLVPAA